jgi:hypothetical protein
MTEDEAKPEMLRSAMESAKETIKACLLIDAGSAAALIAFMGHLTTQKEFQLVEKLAPSNLWFVGGVFAAMLGHGFSYLSNLFFVFWPDRRGDYCRYIAVGVTALSMVFFAVGACKATAALSLISKSNVKTQTTIQSSK